jgi:hypothetical protein
MYGPVILKLIDMAIHIPAFFSVWPDDWPLIKAVKHNKTAFDFSKPHRIRKIYNIHLRDTLFEASGCGSYDAADLYADVV